MLYWRRIFNVLGATHKGSGFPLYLLFRKLHKRIELILSEVEGLNPSRKIVCHFNLINRIKNNRKISLLSGFLKNIPKSAPN